MTYLELLGALRQGTPFYAGYRVRPLLPPAEIAALFSGERGRFLLDIFSHAKKGVTGYTVHPDELALELNQDRGRIVRALDYLAEQGHVELQASDVRYRYERLVPDPDRGALTAALLSFTFCATFKRLARMPFGPFENNIAQTAAASAAVLGFVHGLMAPMPALNLIGRSTPAWVRSMWGWGSRVSRVAVAWLRRS